MCDLGVDSPWCDPHVQENEAWHTPHCTGHMGHVCVRTHKCVERSLLPRCALETRAGPVPSQNPLQLMRNTEAASFLTEISRRAQKRFWPVIWMLNALGPGGTSTRQLRRHFLVPGVDRSQQFEAEDAASAPPGPKPSCLRSGIFFNVYFSTKRPQRSMSAISKPLVTKKGGKKQRERREKKEKRGKGKKSPMWCHKCCFSQTTCCYCMHSESCCKEEGEERCKEFLILLFKFKYTKEQ